MVRQKWLLAIGMFCAMTAVANATLQISVTTDNSVYQLGETVEIFVTAYNPDPQQVTLTFLTSNRISYILDNEYNWLDYHQTSLPVVTTKKLDYGQSFTLSLSHSGQNMIDYPLDIGSHSVVGQFLAIELQGIQGEPVEFNVVPEPLTISLLGFGSLLLRKYTETIF